MSLWWPAFNGTHVDAPGLILEMASCLDFKDLELNEQLRVGVDREIELTHPLGYFLLNLDH
jgi:hypothetical protein